MKLFKKAKNIHFVGIGGAGMIGIARVLLQKYDEVIPNKLPDLPKPSRASKNLRKK